MRIRLPIELFHVELIRPPRRDAMLAPNAQQYTYLGLLSAHVLNYEVQDWLNANDIEYRLCDPTKYHYSLVIDDDEDALMFMIAWGASEYNEEIEHAYDERLKIFGKS